LPEWLKFDIDFALYFRFIFKESISLLFLEIAFFRPHVKLARGDQREFHTDAITLFCYFLSHLTCFQAQGLMITVKMRIPSLSWSSSRRGTSSLRMRFEVIKSADTRSRAALALAIAS
jgi:hypothetical protein